MPTLVDVPSDDAPAVEHADWVEMNALRAKDGNVSVEDTARAFKRPGFVTEDRARVLAEAAFVELADRQKVLSKSNSGADKLYPFKVAKNGEVLQTNFGRVEQERNAVIYVFMLTISRWSMHASHRTLKGIDPTDAFERLCADALLAFWGGSARFANATAIGTSAGRSKRDFPNIVSTLCQRMGEGIGWNKKAQSPGGGDGGLDIVAWRQFCDARAGGLVAFAQCKTGTNWDHDLGRMTPRAFYTKYFHKPLVVDPIPVYMVPNRVLANDWEDCLLQSRGIVFDRCRIAQFAADAKAAAIRDCRTWLKAAFKAGKY